jgi:hypothetical protein
MLLHGVGAWALAVVVLRRALRLRRSAYGLRQRVDGWLSDEYRDLAIVLGVYPIPRLVISDDVNGPMAFRFSQQVILLPAAIVERLSRDELRVVLAHELAHCKRGDLWLNWVQLILLAAWWFHPILWLVHRRVCEAREDCCDDLLLVRGVVSNDAYCDLLMHAAAELCPTLPLNSALGFGDRMHPLGRRMTRITDWHTQRAEDVSSVGAAVVLTCAALLLPGVGEGTLTASGSVARRERQGAVVQGEMVAKSEATRHQSSVDPGPPSAAKGRSLVGGGAQASRESQGASPKGRVTDSVSSVVTAQTLAPGSELRTASPWFAPVGGSWTSSGQTLALSSPWSVVRTSSVSAAIVGDLPRPIQNPKSKIQNLTRPGLLQAVPAVFIPSQRRLPGRGTLHGVWRLAYVPVARSGIWVDRLPGTHLPGVLY